ncbi:MAG: ubiquinol-cytochrome c reductase iron-sulfur subunit [Chloroflexota bacterium]|jgi:cytochrome b6-f complex iron-sulfur subunit
MKRRSFLGVLLGFLSSTALVSLAYPLLRFFAPSSAAGGQRVSVKKEGIPVGGSEEIVVNNVPVIVINRHGKGFVALSRVCTHLGCLVQYERESGRLLCPCHAGLFDAEGNVLSGPPTKPLARLPIRVEGDRLIVG